MEGAAKQSKKQKKAQAFRANKGGNKGKKDEQSLEIPEQEDLDDLNPIQSTSELQVDTEGKGKKRKRDGKDDDDQEKTKKEGKQVQVGEGGTEGTGVVGEVKEGDGERKKKRQRGKKKSEQRAAALEDGKPRLVLFVGNLPWKITVADIETHFKPCGETPIVRILTPKPSPTATAIALSKTKGCAFIEFTTPLALQAALRLHEEELLGRKLNVELTAGGGGNSAVRKNKLFDKNKTLTEERARTKKNKADRDGVPLLEEGDKSGRWKKEEEVEEVKLDKNGKKVRDRRLKKPDNATKERVAKRSFLSSTGANAVKIG